MGFRDDIHRARLGTFLMGVGLGGFADGIFLHQILQWHHMLSSVLPPDTMDTMSVNMMWDGFFHAFVWLITIAGVFLFWSAARNREPIPDFSWLAGWLLIGWGLFNLVEGMVNHHLLNLHQVRYEGDVYGADPLLAWGLGFLVIGGLGFIAAGWILSCHKEHGRQGKASGN